MKTLFDKIEKQTYVDRLELWKMGKLTPDGKYAAKPIFASALFRHLPTHHDYKILRPFCLFAFLFFCFFVFLSFCILPPPGHSHDYKILRQAKKKWNDFREYD